MTLHNNAVRLLSRFEKGLTSGEKRGREIETSRPGPLRASRWGNGEHLGVSRDWEEGHYNHQGAHERQKEGKRRR